MRLITFTNMLAQDGDAGPSTSQSFMQGYPHTQDSQHAPYEPNTSQPFTQGYHTYTEYSAIWTIILSSRWFWVWYFGQLPLWYSEAAADIACWWWSFTWYYFPRIETTTTNYASICAICIPYLTLYLSSGY
jgi:hypothetical protein